jgi:hypothetical protein
MVNDRASIEVEDQAVKFVATYLCDGGGPAQFEPLIATNLRNAVHEANAKIPSNRRFHRIYDRTLVNAPTVWTRSQHEDWIKNTPEGLFIQHSPRLLEDLSLALQAVHRPDLVPHIDRDGPSLDLADSGLSIFLATINAAGEPDRYGWVLCRAVIVPGVRYYRDGSGEPDAVDTVDLLTVGPSETRKIAKAAVLAYLEANIEIRFEIADEDALARDLNNDLV